MTDTKKGAGATTPAQTSQVPATIKARLDEYVTKTLEHLQSLNESGNLDLPKDYSMENAIKGASLKLQLLVDKDGRPALDVCTSTSVVNSMIAMVIDGLNVWKGQGYFIVYDGKLQWQRDYRGNVLRAKRDADVKEVNAQIIYDGDDFTYVVDAATGRQRVVKHETKLDNQDVQKIRGAYAIVVFNDGTSELEVMTMPQIKQSWMQGQAKGNSPAHLKFPDEMAKKTVINRAIKILVGSSDDSEIIDEDKQVTSRNTATKEKGGKKDLNVQDTTYTEVRDEPQAADKAAAGSKDETATLTADRETGEVTETGPGY